MPQYSVVQLVDHDDLMVIKTKFIEGLNIANVTNHGLGHFSKKKYKIYYSPRPLSKPNFSAEIKAVFTAENDACYMAWVFKTFGNFFNLIIIGSIFIFQILMIF